MRLVADAAAVKDSEPPSVQATMDLVVAADEPFDLLSRARTGDAAAFLELVRRHEDKLRALAFRLLGDGERMADALQETFLRAYRALPDFRGDAALSTWLYRIAYNVCLDELRRSRLTLLSLDKVADESNAARDPAEDAALRVDLASALAALPPIERAAVLLVDAHGFDYAAAGAVLGVPAGTVASRLSRARAVLRRALGDPGDEAHPS